MTCSAPSIFLFRPVTHRAWGVTVRNGVLHSNPHHKIILCACSDQPRCGLVLGSYHCTGKRRAYPELFYDLGSQLIWRVNVFRTLSSFIQDLLEWTVYWRTIQASASTLRAWCSQLSHSLLIMALSELCWSLNCRTSRSFKSLFSSNTCCSCALFCVEIQSIKARTQSLCSCREPSKAQLTALACVVSMDQNWLP